MSGTCERQLSKMNIIEVKRKRIGEIDWKTFKKELKQYSGKFYIVKETKQKIFIDNKFVKEYINSSSMKNARKQIKKFKLNLIDYFKEIIENANNIIHEVNSEAKHKKDAINGWDKYTLGFNYHTTDEFNNEIIIEYEGTVVIRCVDDKKFLYDIVGIKKKGM